MHGGCRMHGEVVGVSNVGKGMHGRWEESLAEGGQQGQIGGPQNDASLRQTEASIGCPNHSRGAISINGVVLPSGSLGTRGYRPPAQSLAVSRSWHKAFRSWHNIL